MYTGLNTKNWESEWRREGPVAVECILCGFMLRGMDKRNLLHLLVSTQAVIGQFSGPYSPVRPAKI